VPVFSCVVRITRKQELTQHNIQNQCDAAGNILLDGTDCLPWTSKNSLPRNHAKNEKNPIMQDSRILGIPIHLRDDSHIATQLQSSGVFLFK
jgi:hypothetical protein